jgi:hypothetical protein
VFAYCVYFLVSLLFTLEQPDLSVHMACVNKVPVCGGLRERRGEGGGVSERLRSSVRVERPVVGTSDASHAAPLVLKVELDLHRVHAREHLTAHSGLLTTDHTDYLLPTCIVSMLLSTFLSVPVHTFR